MINWRDYTDKSWITCLEETVKKDPEMEALVFEGQRVTYREYLDNVYRYAKALKGIGVNKGDHVAIWMTNRPEWIYAKWAIDKIGARLIPANTRFKEKELEYQLDHSETSTLIMEEKFLQKIGAIDMLRNLCPELDRSVPGNLRSQKLPRLRNVVCIGDEEHRGCFTLDHFLNRGNGIDDKEIETDVRPDDICAILYTSGTTGLPKGVMERHRNHVCCFAILADYFELDYGDKFLAGLAPFFGNIGLTSFLMPAVVGANTVIMGGAFDPERTLQVIEGEKITHTIVIPTMLTAMLDHPHFDRYDLGSFEVMMCGGAILPRKVIQEALDRFKGLRGILNAYGLVESAGVTASVRIGQSPEEIEQTVGRPLPYCEVKILDADGKELPPGRDGQICTKEVIPGCHFSAGYFKNPEATAELFADGLCHSGDMGRLREDGNLQITGRVKDMILVGGFNIYPAEIESFLLTNPKVKQSSVVGVPDRRLGEIPMAFVELKHGESATEEEIINFCKDNLANTKVPRHVFFVTEFPMTPQAKIQKFKLRERAVKELGLKEIE
ncbi:MAG: AMP-binding protein [Pseudomonadota bacterium]